MPGDLRVARPLLAGAVARHKTRGCPRGGHFGERTMTIKEAMNQNRNAPNCSICGRLVKECGPDAISCCCWACTMKASGKPLPRGKQVCPACATIRQKLAKRETARKRRMVQVDL